MSTPELAESRWRRDTGWEDVAEGLQQDGDTRTASGLPGGFPHPGAARDHDQVEKKLSIFQMGLSLKSEKAATQLRGMRASSLCQNFFVADGYTDLSVFSLPSCLAQHCSTHRQVSTRRIDVTSPEFCKSQSRCHAQRSVSTLKVSVAEPILSSVCSEGAGASTLGSRDTAD